jgi:hypothetical protein
MPTTMRFCLRTLAFLAVLALGLPVSTASAQEADALIGSWATNVATSELTGTPFKSQIRTFDYTENGLILCTLSTVNANGSTTFFHWFTKLDGQQMPEFSRSNRREHINSITLNKIDDHTYEIIGKTLATGKQHLSGTATISTDGKTMTWKTTNLDAQNRENKQVRILEKQ